ncbi:MAG: tyrosine-type recombinase/integrase [Chloroflexi bacterium]|nr:tyrosine-type recombinase/integrase [Chloroflexota bacterium]
MDSILRHFESYLKQHALSPTTIRNYLADLRAFSRWHAARHPRAAAFATADFRAYREHLCNETEHSPATVNRRLQSLRLFGRFLHEKGHAAHNPTRDIERLRNGKANGAAPRTLTPAEITRLCDAISAGRPSLVERDQALVQLMLQAGLRVAEVAALRLRDLVTSSRHVIVEVRGNSHTAARSVPFNAEASRALRDYIAVRPAVPRVDHVFVSQRGQPLSIRSIQRVIDTHARNAGLADVSAQSLRHTCAKSMLEQTQDTLQVAQWLGQRSTRGLGRYANKT